jgi:DsbC/DsbD-like thiol-disulfide interchange protein/cytochrome c biogenesis protein CcdA
MTFALRCLLALLALVAAPATAQPVRERAIAVSLLPEGRQVAAGHRVELAFVMQPRAGWHGYWENPGDAGAPARVEWNLPAGVSASPLRYPVPETLIISGLMNYVYEHDYALLTALDIPADLAPGTRLPIAARLDYLACTDRICVPESATVSTVLEVGVAAGAENRAAIDGYRQALPRTLDRPGRFEWTEGRLRLAVPVPNTLAVEDPYFFPISDGAIDYAAPQLASRNGDWIVVEAKAGRGRPDLVEGVLKIGEGQGLRVAARLGDVPATAAILGSRALDQERGAWAMLLAFAGAIVGGLLLNIMPCVFPILSLKALSLARAGESEGTARREALAYAAGVVIVCVALGGVLLALRASGEAVGWAFQLQDPRVILFLLLLVTAIALNLAGLFELPSLGRGERLPGGSGLSGAFWTGALAAFVATPCTGPFMGAALGAALVLPGAAALAIFAGLGLGLALPFLLLGFVPALRRRLPRPGPWMARFRRILSVPMFLTALALAWILERQAGGTGLGAGAAAVAILAAALWWAGKRHGWLPLAPAAAAVAAAVLFLPLTTAPAAAPSSGVLNAEPFSEGRLAALRAEGRPVFVYFTADWCVTCKINEKAALDRDEVARAFASRNVAVLVGDWTRGDPAIGRFLESHGRSGVPLYLWYAPGRQAEVLPQILTPGRVAALGA